MGDVLSPVTFPPELYRRLVPSQFLLHHLSTQPPVRPDARRPQEFREVSVNTGSLTNTCGSSVVKLGSTIMSCGVRAEITQPDAFHPRSGYIVPNIEIGPLCHSAHRAGPPSDMQQTIAYSLDKLLKNSQVVDEEELCIVEKKAVWVLYVDVICLSHGGSLLSAATLAVVSALLSTSLPIARWELDCDAVRCTHEYSPLKIRTVPHVVEFGIFNGVLLADITEEEEGLCAETISITLSKENILAVSKTGGGSISAQDVDQVVALAEKRVKAMDTIVRASQKHRL